MAAHARLKNEFTDDEKYHNLMRWLKCCLFSQGSYLPNQRILMTKNPNASRVVGASSPWLDDARLVDGNTTQDGRLDMYYRGKWRGVCTNYNK